MTDNKDNENENGYYSANNPFYYGFPGNNNQVATNLYIATSNNIASNANFITNTCPKPQSDIVFITQPANLPLYPNGSQSTTLLGAPLIPMFTSDKIVSATEKNLQIIQQVKREKEKASSMDIQEIYKRNKNVKKCDLHPKQLSDKCRKCKEIKSILEKEFKSDDTFRTEKNETVSEDPQLEDNSCIIDVKKLVVNAFNRSLNLVNPDDQPPQKLFKIYGDPVGCNMNPMILNNILSCQYFKEQIAIKTFPEIVQEIIDNVTYVDAWAVGMSGIPSTLFCCLYKLMLLKLTEYEVEYLRDHQNPYVRAVGFLFIRYLSDPRDLWDKLSTYLHDEQVFTPRPDKKIVMKMGDYVESLLVDYNYYGTRLPRIPTTIEREIKAKIMKGKIFEKDEDKRNHSRSRSSSRIRKEKKSKKRLSPSRSRSRSRSRKERKHKKKHKKRSSSRKRHSRSRNSRTASQTEDKKDIIKTIRDQERESATAKGRDYAFKPTSYKSSLSHRLPGTTITRSRSPSPLTQNICIIEKKAETKVEILTETKEYSKDFLERQEILKKQYTLNSSQTKKKSKEDEDSEYMRLG